MKMDQNIQLKRKAGGKLMIQPLERNKTNSVMKVIIVRVRPQTSRFLFLFRLTSIRGFALSRGFDGLRRFLCSFQRVQDATHEHRAEEIFEREKRVDAEKRENSQEDEEDDERQVQQRVFYVNVAFEVEKKENGGHRARLRHAKRSTQSEYIDEINPFAAAMTC